MLDSCHGQEAILEKLSSMEKKLRATTHIIEEKVDYGRILMVSHYLPVDIPDDFNPKDKRQLQTVSDEHQNRLKVTGDWVIFPRTLEYIADGRYSQDEQGNLYFDNKRIPNGLKLEELK